MSNAAPAARSSSMYAAAIPRLLPQRDVGIVVERPAVVGGVERLAGDVDVELGERLLAGGDPGGPVAAPPACRAVPVLAVGARGAQHGERVWLVSA